MEPDTTSLARAFDPARGRRAALGLVALAVAACSPAAPTPVSNLLEGAIELAQRDSTEARAPAAGGYRELVQSGGLVQGVDFAPGERGLVYETWVKRGERMERDALELSSIAPIEAVAACAPWELYVALREEDGTVVVQRWLVRPPARSEGASAAERAREANDAAATVVRSTLARTGDLAGVRVLACDPEGRYLLALDRAGERVLQFSTLRGAQGYASFEAERLPALRTACGLFRGRHVQHGTVWAFEASSEHGVERALFVDRDEDGAFDEVSNLDASAWAASEYAGAAWSEHRFVPAR
ncbi:MAG: hypothetical protein IPJ77_22255 [Planctomycetes bacterium]|nr:hypothetical protein [Planctomycetota bacterium]